MMEFLICPERDSPFRVAGQCADALGILLSMESASALDPGQREMVEQAIARLAEVEAEGSE